MVFSYRFEWNENNSSLFANSTWFDYRRESLAQSKQFAFVLQTDIADFYPRVSHHRLDNALKRLGGGPETTIRIIKLLGIFSHTLSNGRPILGGATSLLA